MAAAEETGASCFEVVIAVEGTSNMVSHWDIIKKNYILPAINHFHEQSCSNDDLFTSSNGNKYGLVLFHAADVVPQPLSQCFAPTSNVHTFTKMLDSIKFGGGGGEQFSHVNEGLATALQLFNEFSSAQTETEVKKLCFIVSNTPPYQLPVVESFEYSGLMLNQIAEKLSENAVNISVISPRHIHELQQIFLKGNSNQPSLMNYAQDRRHLVLISGFRLPTEREPIPVNEMPDKITTSIKTEDSYMETSSPVTSNNPPEVSKSEVPVEQKPNKPIFAMNPVSNLPAETSKFIASTAAPIPVPVPNASTVSSTNLQQNNQPPSSMMQNILIGQTSNSVPTSSLGTVMTADSMPQLTSQPGFNAVTPQSNTTFPSTSAKGILPPDGGPAGSDSLYPAAQKEADRVVQFAQKGSAPKIIWNGTLEWKQTRRPQSGANGQAIATRLVHSVHCQIVQPQQNNPPPDIDTSSWPNKLTVQFIPQTLLQHPSIHMYLQPRMNKTVSFAFPMPSTLPLLMSQFQKTVVGLINANPPEYKEIILLFLKKKDNKPQFFGLIPPDPTGLMNAIKANVNAVRERSQNQASSAADAGGMHTITSMPVSTSGNVEMHGSTTMPGQGNSQVQGFRQQFQPTRPYHGVQSNLNQSNMQMSNAVPRFNQPVQQGHRLTISPSQQNQQQRLAVRQKGILIRNPMQDSGMMGTATRNTVTMPNQLSGNLPPGSNTGSMISNQRVMPPGSGQINMPNKTNMVRMQMHNMRSNMNMGAPIHEQTHLRQLLRNDSAQSSGLSIRTTDNAPMQQTATNNLQQQQTYMQRPNLMQGMQNNQNTQRRY